MSVVTPVYNGEPYLRACIESVLAQTYSNFEFIVQNNCSSDATAAIVEEYARADPRVKLRNGESFLPIIANHNAAISSISPESVYCKPLMADDWLLPDCVAKMVAAARAAPEVGLVCCYAIDGREVMWQGLRMTGPPGQTVSYIPGREIGRATLLGGPYVFGTPSSCLLRSDLVRKRRPFYNPTNLHADHESCYDVLTESDFAFVHEVLVFNRVHSDSVSASAAASESLTLGSLTALITFGNYYLSQEEFRIRLERRFYHYYRMLADNLFRAREPRFWELHRRRLNELGYRLDIFRLLRAVLGETVRRLVQPFKGLVRRPHGG